MNVDTEERVEALLKGAVDLHVHSGPSLHPRKIDHFEALRQADAVGMKAVLLKDHYYPTMPVATLINDNLGLQTRAIGALVLNNPVGGMNPSAVDYALKQGARVVWMATAHAENHLEHERKDKDFSKKFPVNQRKTVEAKPARLTDAKDVVLDDIKEILDLIAENDAAVSGGHHHVSELFPFYEEARRRGVKRLFVNHPTYVNECTLQDVASLVSMGVLIEHSICMYVPSTFHFYDQEHLRSVIDAAGIEKTFFGSDLGQKNNPTPVEGYRGIIRELIALGYDDGDIRKMVGTNAARFIGLE